MAQADKPAIVIHQLSKSFQVRGVPPAEALRDISLTIDSGSFVTLVGPSGCGKSTLLRVISGLDTPTTGRVVVNGGLVKDTSREVGLVFQRPTLLPWRTVEQNVRLPNEMAGMKHTGFRLDASQLIGLVGLAGFEKHYPAQLSGGMQQRAAIARSLAHDPPILLLDEPFGALDALLRERMGLELQRIWQATGKTVVLVTHSINEAVLLGDRVVVLTPRPGRLAADITVHLARPRTLEMIETPAFSHFAGLVRRTLMEEDGSGNRR
jgi:NitT/TauT family transport system ATP-binding protein